MPANLTFTQFVSDTVLFQNKEAANTFFSNIVVPDSTPTTYGVSKQATSVSFTPAAYDNEDNVLFAVVGGTNVYVPTLDHIEAVKTRLETLETTLGTILTRLKSAEIMANS